MITPVTSTKVVIAGLAITEGSILKNLTIIGSVVPMTMETTT